MHLAAENHVDRSINNPEKFLFNNIIGTYNLLEVALIYFQKLDQKKRKLFKLLHVSTDEVYGSLGEEGMFNEYTPYNPRSPYSATKASSDHLVNAWHHTYGLPILITNCSNNFGPWQYPEKFIPNVILKAINGEIIPIYGDGKNVRDWLFVKDHVRALLTVLGSGNIGESYCIGGNNERNNNEVAIKICNFLDILKPESKPHSRLINFVRDRPGHDFRYSIDSQKIFKSLNWSPLFSFDSALKNTVDWYLKNLDWCNNVKLKGNYDGSRIA